MRKTAAWALSRACTVYPDLPRRPQRFCGLSWTAASLTGGIGAKDGTSVASEDLRRHRSVVRGARD